jgi:predicted DNA-binding transcriptional regulator AlpA
VTQVTETHRYSPLFATARIGHPRTVPAVTISTQRRIAALQPATDLTLTQLGTWMSMDDVCALLGESRSTIDKWRRRGVFPKGTRKPNGRVMFRRPDVATFLNELEVAA